MAASSAGHPPILWWRAATGSIDELTVPQIPLGMFEDRVFSSSAIAAEPDDLFVIVTDGLTEVFDGRDVEFGLERLAQTIRQHARGPLPEIADAVMQAVRRHGRQADDQTLLLVRVR